MNNKRKKKSVNVGNQHTDTAADGRGYRGGKKWKVRNETHNEKYETTVAEMERSRSVLDARDVRRGRQRGRKTERGRQQSGLPQWVRAA